MRMGKCSEQGTARQGVMSVARARGGGESTARRGQRGEEGRARRGGEGTTRREEYSEEGRVREEGRALREGGARRGKFKKYSTLNMKEMIP